jgi:hypothetical protein
MSRDRDRRIAALEGRHQTVTTSAWEPILAELSEEALEDLHYVMELAHPDPESPSWKVIYSEPPGWDGPEWIASGPVAEHRYQLWHRAKFPGSHSPDTRPPRQIGGWPEYLRPKDEMEAKVFDVLLADAPNPETFERWLQILEAA